MANPNVLDHVKDQKQIILKELNSLKNCNNDNDKKKKTEEIISKVNQLKTHVHQYRNNMIAYDIRTCNELIKELETEIKKEKSLNQPTKSFKFSWAPKKEFVKSEIEVNVEDKSVKTITIDESVTKGFKNLTNQDLLLDRTETQNKDIFIESLKNCNVQIIGTPTSIRLIKLLNCKVFTGPVLSSVYIEDCNGCNFQLISRQIRIHETKNCEFNLHVANRTIIENCNELTFGPHDWSYDHLDEDFIKSGINQTTNNWQQIDDFNCLNYPSSNYKLKKL